MSERSDRELLSDIREAIQRISEYSANFDYASFVDDTKTQDAVIRNLEILGEATKRLSEEFRTPMPACHGRAWRLPEIV